MKKKKFLLAFSGSLLALSVTAIANVSGGGLQLFGFNANADGGLYSLTLNRNTNTLDFEGDTTTVTTTLGNHVNFTHSGVTKLEGKVGVLAADGYIQNTEKITGMTSITVEFSGTLTIEYAWENTTMLVKEELSSGVEYTFYDKAPSYFKLVNTGDEEAEIDLIDINYSCEYTIKKVIQINYLYKESSEKISNPTYLILDKGERYGQEGVSGKGKLTVGTDTYLPNKFWVAGIADKNEVIDITYTKASVYDGTYNPTTDTTRVLEGSGTTDNPYLIKSVEDLLWVEANTHKVDHTSSYELKTSIDMTGYKIWYGICSNLSTGTTWKWFKGNFIGNGYTIAGMNLEKNYNGLALISNIDGGVVTDFTLQGSIKSSSTGGRAGAICYQGKNATISNVNSYVSVTYSATSGSVYAGGVLGSVPASTVSNIVNYADITSQTASTMLGGVVGYANVDSTFIRCINYGAITSKGKQVGGIVGASKTATIAFCENYGSVTASSSLGNIVGQFTTASKVYGCIAGGNVYTGSCIGAIVGYCGAGSYVYGLNGHLEATEEFPANIVLEGIEVQGVTYPTEGKFKLIGDDQNNAGPYYI